MYMIEHQILHKFSLHYFGHTCYITIIQVFTCGHIVLPRFLACFQGSLWKLGPELVGKHVQHLGSLI